MALAGKRVRTSDITPRYFISKAANETVTSSTAMQDDDDFVGIALEAGKYYWITAILHASGAAAGDVKVGWTTTATISDTGRSCIGPSTGTADVTASAVMRCSNHAYTTAIAYGIDGAASTCIMEHLRFYCDVAGTLTMQWAQNTSNATGTTLSAASYLTIEELVPYGT